MEEYQHRRLSGPVRLWATMDPQRWAAACEASTQPVGPFHDLGWLRLVTDLIGGRLTALVVRHRDRDVGVAPWLTRRVGPLTTANRVPFPYLGPLVPPALLPATLAQLRLRGLRRGVLMQQAQFTPDARVPEDLAGAGYRRSEDHTWLVDTTRAEEETFAAVASRTRQKLRRAQRLGVEVSTTGARDQVMRRFMDEVTARHGFRSDYSQPMPATLEHLEGQGFTSRWTVARQDGQEIGTLLTLLAGGRAIGWIGGVLLDHQASHANVALTWDAIAWAGQQGARSLDMLGGPRPGIDEFKKQFGSVRVPYPVLTTSLPGVERAHASWRARQVENAAAAGRQPSSQPA